MTNSLSSFKLVFEGILLLPVSVIGVVANIFNIQFLILKQKEIDFAKSFTNLLIVLSLFDLLFLLNAIGLFGLPEVSGWYTEHIYTNILPISIGLASIGRVGSVGVTVSIAFERYFSVCQPTTEFTQKYLLGIIPISFALLYNIPKFFEIVYCSDEEKYLTVVWSYLKESFGKEYTIDEANPNLIIGFENTKNPLQQYLLNSNNTWALKALEQAKGTAVMCDPHGHRPSTFSINHWYIIFYKFLSDLIFVEIIPWITVIVLNFLVWKETKKFHQIRSKLLSRNGNYNGQGTNGNSKQSKLLLSIIVMFVFCQCFTIIPDIYELKCALSSDNNDQQCQQYTYHLIEIAHFMLSVNSSINFIFYTIHIKLFRETFTKFICKCLPCLSIRCRNIFPKCIPKRDCRVESILLESNKVVVVSPDIQRGEEVSHA